MFFLYERSICLLRGSHLISVDDRKERKQPYYIILIVLYPSYCEAQLSQNKLAVMQMTIDSIRFSNLRLHIHVKVCYAAVLKTPRKTLLNPGGGATWPMLGMEMSPRV